jgi:hypothetical protein
MLDDEQVQKPVIPSVNHHRQNPLGCKFKPFHAVYTERFGVLRTKIFIESALNVY